MSRAVTLQDIADRCGVARGTVSLALRRDPRVNVGTTERIRAAATELGYDPTIYHEARRLVARRNNAPVLNHLIALAMPAFFFKSSYFNTLQYGAVDYLSDTSYGILSIFFKDGELTSKEGLPLSLLRGEVDGIVTFGYPYLDIWLYPHLHPYPHLRHLPIVSMIQQQAGLPAVITDDEMGSHQATEHLLALGHRHLLFLSLESYHVTDTFTRKRNGVLRALTEHGLDPQVYLHEMAMGYVGLEEWNSSDPVIPARLEASVQALLHNLRGTPRCTAILAHNDLIALFVWYLLRRNGIRVPEEVSLVGFDDTDPIPDEYGQNILTTVRLPLCDVGRRAAELMVGTIAGRAGSEMLITLPTELIVRKTTGLARSDG